MPDIKTAEASSRFERAIGERSEKPPFFVKPPSSLLEDSIVVKPYKTKVDPVTGEEFYSPAK